MLRQKKKQLYFNVVLIYTNNKEKLKEGKRRKWLCNNFPFIRNLNLFQYFFSFQGENYHFAFS